MVTTTPLTSLMGSSLQGLGVPPALIGSIAGIKGTGLIGALLTAAIVGLLSKQLQSWIRRGFSYIYEAIFPTACIVAEDPAFEWVLAYLAKDPSVQASLGAFRLSTSDRDQSLRNQSSIAINSRTRQKEFDMQLKEEQASFQFDGVVARLVPYNDRWVKFAHLGQTIWIRRKSTRYAGSQDISNDHMEICTLFFQQDALKNLLSSVHKAYMAKSDSEIRVYTPMLSLRGDWTQPAARPGRPWESVVLPSNQKEELLVDAQNFLSENCKQWYKDRGIPHRRGYLFHGSPGAGKTSLITAMATKLKLDIYILNPSNRSMDDSTLQLLLLSCSSGSIVVIEDIDCIMPIQRQNLSENEMTEAEIEAQAQKNKGNVTLSGLLNAIDGIASQEDCILVASTNHPERLDHALVRPGRFDVKIDFDWVRAEQARDLFLHLYPHDVFATKAPCSGGGEQGEKASTEKDERQDLALRFFDVFDSLPTLFDGSKVEISMAALQGYCMKFKTDPQGAYDGLHPWLETVKAKQDKQLEFDRAKDLDEAKDLDDDAKTLIEDTSK